MRLFITTLSMFSVIGFGYALAGYGGTLFGNAMRIDYVSFGLITGFGCGLAAMLLWYRNRKNFFYDDDLDHSGEFLQDVKSSDPE